jgi:hypothetical protein
MTPTVGIYFLIVMFVSLLAFVMDPLRVDGNRIRFNRIAPVPPLIFTFLVTVGMVTQDWVQWEAGVPMIVFFGWGAYAGLMFGYEYDGMRYCWFNGLWRRSVAASEIQKIVFLRDSKRTAKIRFECERRILHTRSDFSIVHTLVLQMAEEHGIEHHSHKLPWWSV